MIVTPYKDRRQRHPSVTLNLLNFSRSDFKPSRRVIDHQALHKLVFNLRLYLILHGHLKVG